VIEHDLRSLLAERAESVPDNPTRLSEVRSRVATTRRRRAAGAAFALVLVALAGLVVTRLPGRPETLPAGVPTGPYFGDDGEPRRVAGYSGSTYFAFRGDAGWALAGNYPPRPAVVVARCERRGDLTLRDLVGPGTEQRLSCRVPVGGHYEGALLLNRWPTGPGATGTPAVVTAAVRPGSSGDWMVGVLQPLYPERLTAADLRRPLLNGRRALLDGFRSPAGGEIPLTLSSDFTFGRGVFVMATCVRGVRLRLALAGRDAGELTCDDRSATLFGLVNYPIRDPFVAGLRPGQRITLEVRPVESRNGQWAILQVG
jgi:hypothetical protein